MNDQVIVEADFVRQTGTRIGYQVVVVLEGEVVVLNVGLAFEVDRCHSQIKHLQSSRLQANLSVLPYQVVFLQMFLE